MTRRKKGSTRHRHAGSYTSERSAPAATSPTAPEVRPAGYPSDRPADIGGRAYEAVYSVSSGYTADRLIVLLRDGPERAHVSGLNGLMSLHP
jgi:hypothetical protein